MKKIFLIFCRIIYKCIGTISPLFKTLVIHSDIEALERREKYTEARELRHKYLNSLKRKYLSPLWGQEGFDLLYQVKDFELSLVAFQNAIDTLELCPALYGVASPLDIYFGASMAAVSAQKYKLAKEYYQEFTEQFNSCSKNPKLEKALRNYKESMSWIEQNIKNNSQL